MEIYAPAYPIGHLAHGEGLPVGAFPLRYNTTPGTAGYALLRLLLS